MHISWIGTTGIKIQAKPFDEDVTVVIDAYKPDKGTAPRSLTPHIALFTRGSEGSITLSGEPFTLSTPGECETKGILVTAVAGKKEGEVFFRIDAEGMSLAHLGLTKDIPTNDMLAGLGDIDILCIPVGHPDAYDTDTAMKVVNAIEPRVVIPIAMKSDNDPSAAAADAFVRDMGGAKSETLDKVILKKKDLPEEDMRVIVLNKE